MSKRLLTVSLALAVASALIFIPLTAGGQEGRSEGAQPGPAVGGTDGGGTVDQGTWDGDGPQPRDQVINDDLIVDGSICVGLDCANGESFGFDTLRLKENNTRIKFDDTSNSASFPRNDWQLTANDSSNGGAEKFSIDDITNSRTPFTLEGSAPSHSLYVDDGGRVGFGTSTPVTELHVVDGDTPTLRLEQDGSSGFTAQTWDVASNETNFFVRDATNGSRLPLRIRPQAPSNSIFVDTDGDIGIGTSSPDSSTQIHVANDNAVGVLISKTGGTGFSTMRLVNPDTTSGSGETWDVRTTSAGGFAVTKSGTGQIEFEIDASGNVTVRGNVTITGNLTINGTCTDSNGGLGGAADGC